MNRSMTKLSIRGLTKSYAKTRVIEDFSLEVESGELLTILGPSGCGKSTLLACTAGIEEMDKGVLFLDGDCVFDSGKGIFVPPEERNIGFVFQSYALWPHMTVERNLSYPLRIRRKSKAEIAVEVERVLRLLRLEGKEKRYPPQLSGGEQQRVALGRALIMHPSLLLLDEPLSNLDARLREDMQVEIRSLQQKLGLTIIHVTHDQAEAMALSDRIAVMHKGRIVQIGEPAGLYQRPETPFAADFMGMNNLIEGMIREENGRKRFDNGSGLQIELPPGTADFTGPAILVVRPEDIILHSEKADTDAIPAVVLNRLYRGPHFIYTLAGCGSSFRVLTGSQASYRKGAELFFELKKCVYLRDSRASG